jgi:hypothetical protein
MTLQEAIDFASGDSYEKQYGTITNFTVSMHNTVSYDTVLAGWETPVEYEPGEDFTVHEDSETVLAGFAWFETYAPGEPGGKPTFHPDLPLRNWGPATIDPVRAVTGRWFERPPVPGFSTRGQGGMMLNAAAGGGTPIPIDVSVRRDPGLLRFLSFPGLGPSVQMEIEKLSGPGGTATSGVTLKAVEDGALLRAVGPSVRDPASRASYTVTIWVGGRPG